VNLVMHRASDRDCQLAMGRDFQLAKAGRERQVALTHLDEQEHQDGLGQRQELQLRALQPMAGRMERRVLLQQPKRPVERRAQLDELVLAQAHWGLARQALPQPAQQQGPE